MMCTGFCVIHAYGLSFFTAIAACPTSATTNTVSYTDSCRTMAFVVAFSSFLGTCIDYQKVPSSKRMPDILISQCTQRIRGSASLLLWILALFWFYKIFDYIRDFWRLRSIQNFYVHLLKVPDSDMQTISWPEIVRRIVALRDLNSMTADRQRSAKPRIDAHSIANRIMRRDNYFIALINKDILDFSLPIPYLQNRQLFSRTLEWNLQFCILDFVFDSRGHVRTLFLKDSHRHALIQGLRSRFVFAGCLSLLCGPFVVLYYVLVFFFRYFTEFQRNPSQIASRQYSPFAEWKFREFNELQHLFERRLNMSHPFAQRYMDQFPKDKTVQVAGLVAFVAGALASVLAVASLIDPESFLSFEVTHDRTVLFYLGIFGTIWAVARANMTEENLVFDPEYALRNVTDFTHYSPRRWQGRLHTNEVRADFARLYQTKVYIFLEEVLSIILAPLVLWFSLPRSCEGIVDFFREFTVHVDGLGHICSFALFDFHKTADAKLPEAAHTDDLRADYYSTQDNKMMASYYGFQDAYGPRSRPGALYHYEAGKGVHSRPSKSPWQSQTRPSVLQSPPDQLGKRPLRYAKLDMTPEQPEAQASRPRTSTESTTDLGGSWKTTRAGVLEESRASPEESTAGVLNMVYGLSRAQNDGQGARFA